MKRCSLVLLLLGLAGCDGPGGIPAGLPEGTGQVMVVTTPAWTSTAGRLQRYERAGEGWRKVGAAMAVTVGRTGMAWGPGLHRAIEAEPQKREGDGKAPAGVFGLDTAFGYAAAGPAGLRFAYRQATEQDYFVDDPKVASYNRWERLAEGAATSWSSAERMKRSDGLYELGYVVAYNAAPVVPGRGSAIFLHLWEAPGVPTEGCTAMAREDMLTLMRWLDPGKKPLLVQGPAGEVSRIRLP
jgi:L,D-peptidoglycan transpeptidase YkuD (ErfK/YbiS/YcfS/YnhG family)